MKIVNLERFRAMPEGTVFSKYAPQYFEDTRVKGATWETDFLYADLSAEAVACSGSEERDRLIYAAEHEGSNLKMDFDLYGRDGYFESEQLFAVWEKEDVLALVAKLNDCLSSDAYPAVIAAQPIPATLPPEAPVHDSDHN